MSIYPDWIGEGDGGGSVGSGSVPVITFSKAVTGHDFEAAIEMTEFSARPSGMTFDIKKQNNPVTGSPVGQRF